MDSKLENSIIRTNLEHQEPLKAEEETNEELIHKKFIEQASSEIMLLANNLHRPDGFAKTLIIGKIFSSQELKEKIGPDFTKTHLSDYMGWSPDFSKITNDHISFSVGRPQRFYSTAEKSRIFSEEWSPGFGFTLPAEPFLQRQDVAINFGNFHISSALKKIENTDLFEPQFEKYYELDLDQLDKIDLQPAKKDFLNFVNIARKTDQLTGEDQAEIHLQPQPGKLPSLSLQEMVILIPHNKQEAIKRYLSIQLKRMAAFNQKLKDNFDLNVESLDSEKVLARYSNIYWYPQANIDSAVKYLSTHKEKVTELLASNV